MKIVNTLFCEKSGTLTPNPLVLMPQCKNLLFPMYLFSVKRKVLQPNSKCITHNFCKVLVYIYFYFIDQKRKYSAHRGYGV